MPGYYAHFAASNRLARQNRSFLCGVEMPDLLKHYYSIYGIVGAKEKYDQIKTSDMPDFSTFESRVQQVETDGSKNGLHYGISSNPDLRTFWNSLKDEQKKNPFYLGYFWHLLTDFVFYNFLDIDQKIKGSMKNGSKEKSLSTLKPEEVKRMIHEDWDRTNQRICDTYSDIVLPQEIEELGVVKFRQGKVKYVDWDIMKNCIDFLRQVNPLTENMDDLLESVLDLKESN